MKTILAIICILFGGFGWVAQLVSGINYPLAQKLGLQEKDEGTDPLFRLAEMNAARWDACVLWTLAAAGILMLTDHPWWPLVLLVAGAIYLDGAGREVAKWISLSRGGVKVGSPKDMKLAAIFYGVMAAIAVWAIAYALWSVA